MRRQLVVQSFLIPLVVAAVCRGDEPSLAESIAPYVDGQTVAVVHVDLAAFEAAGAIDLLADFLHLPAEERDRLQALVVPINVFAGTLPEGARADVFVVVSLSDLAGLPFFFVVPRETNAASAAIAMEVRRSLADQFHTEVAMEQIGESLVTGSRRTIDRLKQAKPAERAEIAAAFAAAGPGALELLVVPSADARRAIELLYPKLPEELGGGPTSQWTRNVEWLAVGIALTPGQTRLRVRVQATGEEEAALLVEKISNIVAPLGKRRELGDAVPDAEAQARRLVPTAKGNQLSLELTVADDEVSHMGSLLSPLLKTAAGAIAQRRVVQPGAGQ